MSKGRSGFKEQGYSKRIESVDVAKGIAILSIMAGHVGWKNAEGIDILANAVFQYHVPIFYFLAGYFLSAKLPLCIFVRQKAHRLLVPYAFTCLCIAGIMLILRLFVGNTNVTFFQGLKELGIAALYGCGSLQVVPEGIKIIGAIWFLEALFIGLVEVRLLMPYKRAAPIIVLLLAVLATMTRKYFWLPFNLQTGFFAGGYIYIGYLLRRWNFLRFDWDGRIFLGVLVLLTAMFCLFYWEGITVSAASAGVGPYCLGFIASVCGSLLVMMLSHLISERSALLKRVLEFYDQNSLVILCAHLVMLDCGYRELLLYIGTPMEDPTMFCADFFSQLLIVTLCIIIVHKTSLRRIFY